MKETLNSVVLFLEGKKAIILSVIGVVLSFLVTDGTLTPAMGTMLQSILSLLAGGAIAIQETQGFSDYKFGKLGHR